MGEENIYTVTIPYTERAVFSESFLHKGLCNPVKKLIKVTSICRNDMICKYGYLSRLSKGISTTEGYKLPTKRHKSSKQLSVIDAGEDGDESYLAMFRFKRDTPHHTVTGEELKNTLTLCLNATEDYFKHLYTTLSICKSMQGKIYTRKCVPFNFTWKSHFMCCKYESPSLDFEVTMCCYTMASLNLKLGLYHILSDVDCESNMATKNLSKAQQLYDVCAKISASDGSNLFPPEINRTYCSVMGLVCYALVNLYKSMTMIDPEEYVSNSSHENAKNIREHISFNMRMYDIYKNAINNLALVEHKHVMLKDVIKFCKSAKQYHDIKYNYLLCRLLDMLSVLKDTSGIMRDLRDCADTLKKKKLTYIDVCLDSDTIITHEPYASRMVTLRKGYDEYRAIDIKTRYRAIDEIASEAPKLSVNLRNIFLTERVLTNPLPCNLDDYILPKHKFEPRCRA